MARQIDFNCFVRDGYIRSYRYYPIALYDDGLIGLWSSSGTVNGFGVLQGYYISFDSYEVAEILAGDLMN